MKDNYMYGQLELDLGDTDKDDDIIVISLEEYAEMKEELRWLQCLEEAGVDNWDGYDYALELYDSE